MKKLSILALTALLLTGCGNTTAAEPITTDIQETTIPAAAEESSQETDEESTQEAETIKIQSFDSVNSDDVEGAIDVDLTQLSAGMVYGQVYDMVYNSDGYIGQTVKMRGPFNYYKDPQTGQEYFAVMISDATACCSQGIEFILDGDYKFPDDYPEVGTDITVVGKFNYYKEDYNTYCQLTEAKMET